MKIHQVFTVLRPLGFITFCQLFPAVFEILVFLFVELVVNNDIPYTDGDMTDPDKRLGLDEVFHKPFSENGAVKTKGVQ